MNCHQSNWNTSYYKTARLKSFISFVATPIAQNMAQNVAQNMAQNVVQDMAQNVVQDMAQDVAQDVAQDIEYFYAVTVTNHDNVEIYQEDCPNLKEALEIINERYGHWEFVEMAANKKSTDGDGCSTCAAH